MKVICLQLFLKTQAYLDKWMTAFIRILRRNWALQIWSYQHITNGWYIPLSLYVSDCFKINVCFCTALLTREQSAIENVNTTMLSVPCVLYNTLISFDNSIFFLHNYAIVYCERWRNSVNWRRCMCDIKFKPTTAIQSSVYLYTKSVQNTINRDYKKTIFPACVWKKLSNVQFIPAYTYLSWKEGE